MNVLEFMSFDPSWFITVPGLLITGGVLLLLIALIVFVATSKKDKGASVDPTVEGSIPLVNGPDDTSAATFNAGMPTDMSNMMNQQPVSQNMGVGAMDAVAMNAIPSSVDTNSTVPVGSMPTVPSDVPDFSQNVTEQVQAAPVNIAPVAAGLTAPGDVSTADATSQIAFDAPQDVPISLNVPQDNSQVIDFGSVQQPAPQNVSPATSRPIYGGANPMENTATIPTVSNHAAYNGEVIVPSSVVEEVKVVEQPSQTPIQGLQQTAVANNSADVIPNVVSSPAPAVSASVPVPAVESGVVSEQTPTPAVNLAPPTPVAENPEGIESLF